MFHKLKILVIALVLVSFLTPKRAAAVSSGDAALTVVISTAAGAVLGASTLPFYADSGKHMKNIFYGAALGAVVGVFFAAYAGVQEGAPEDEEAFLKYRKHEPLPVAQWSSVEKITYQDTLTKRVNSPFSGSDVMIWSPVAKLSF